MWVIRQQDIASKERLSKFKLLESLIAKQELADYEEVLKKKLVDDLSILVLVLGRVGYCHGVLVFLCLVCYVMELCLINILLSFPCATGHVKEALEALKMNHRP
ncbi:hypothetical protein F2Q70_00002070 [Brassica cretica]|uniref:Uncharacterized protein n=1 Tax=Brassica cretica TaxID=69181 RepID=A0A8S9IPD1_BRACR|nr:hypothetical protein F2Q70_00002070 [Brassica cretica]